MKDFTKLLRYIIPYKANAIGNVLLSLLSIIFSVFSLGVVIPFINLITGEDELITTAPPMDFTNSESVFQNLYYLMSKLIVQHGNERVLVIIALGMIVLFFLKNLTRYMAKFVIAPLRNGIIQDIRNQIYEKINKLPLSFYSTRKRGDIISRATSDVQNIEWTIMASLEMMFQHTFTLIIYLGVLFWLQIKLSLIMILILPIAGLVIGKIGKALKRKSITAQEKMGSIMSSYEEGIGGLRIIKAFNAAKKENAKFAHLNKQYTSVMNGVLRRTDLASPLSEFLSIIITAVILWYGGKLVLSGEGGLNGAEFIGYLMIFSQLLPSIKAFASGFYNIQKGTASAQRVWEILEADESIRDIPNPEVKKSFTDAITYNNVSFKYKDDLVLKNVNLTIRKGETIALVGASGAGKSTMADLLPRFFDLENGEIMIDGTNVKNIAIKDVRDLMGIVTQESILFNDTILNNIAFGSDHIDMGAAIAAAKAANAHDFITSTPESYQTVIGDRGNQLSGGQRQRLTIARALYKNPPIMILDEATSSLDTESEKLVQDALNNLMKNRTSLVIAHRLSTIQKANKIVVMEQGEIIEEGNHQELLEKKGTYYKLHKLQNND